MASQFSALLILCRLKHNSNAITKRIAEKAEHTRNGSRKQTQRLAKQNNKPTHWLGCKHDNINVHLNTMNDC